jgi:hypothetical protein
MKSILVSVLAIIATHIKSCSQLNLFFVQHFCIWKEWSRIFNHTRVRKLSPHMWKRERQFCKIYELRFSHSLYLPCVLYCDVHDGVNCEFLKRRGDRVERKSIHVLNIFTQTPLPSKPCRLCLITEMNCLFPELQLGKLQTFIRTLKLFHNWVNMFECDKNSWRAELPDF